MSNKNNRFHEIAVFAQVVESGNFTKAADILEVDPSTISKLMHRLERRINARLIQRNTRKLTLTQEGSAYYQRVKQILSDLNAAEEVLGATSEPQGQVRLTCSIPFALHQLIPLLPTFNKQYPKIKITLLTTDKVVDLLASQCDLAIRIGNLKDSNLKVRKLTESKMLYVASPKYLKRYGVPVVPADLNHHMCLNIFGHRGLNTWLFKNATRFIEESAFSADTGESILKMAIAGGGIARLSAYMVNEAIQKGTLVRLLEDCNRQDWQKVYILHPDNIARRVKVFIEFLFTQFQGSYFE